MVDVLLLAREDFRFTDSVTVQREHKSGARTVHTVTTQSELGHKTGIKCVHTATHTMHISYVADSLFVFVAVSQ